MENEKSQPLEIRAKKPFPIQINRIWVIIGIIFIGALLLIALLSTFSPKKQPAAFSQEASSQQVNPATPPALNGLPANYQDTKTISEYLKFKQTLSPEVQNELDLLRSQQTILQSQLSSLQQDKTQPPPQMQQQADMHLQEAQTSGLFFPGGAPENKAQTTETTTSTTPTADSTQTKSAYAEQNMQKQKLSFLKPDNAPEDIYNQHQLQTPISPYEIQAGTVIPSVLITGVESSLPGTLIAQVRDDVYDTITGQYLLIPKGSKLLGEYQSEVSYGQVRALVVFNRIIRPDGTSILLSKFTGADLQGQAGVQGSVDNHWGRVLGAATLSTILSVGAGVASNNYNNNTNYPSATQNAITGGAGSISETGQTLTNRAIDIQPTLKIPAGYEFNVIVNKDMIMSPYKT